MRILMTVLLAGPRQSTIRVDDDAVHVRMGVGGWTFVATVPRSSIVAVDRVGRQRVWAWGAHGWKGRWLVNGSNEGLVRLTLDPRVHARTLGYPLRVRELILSLAEPDDFVARMTPPAQ